MNTCVANLTELWREELYTTEKMEEENCCRKEPRIGPQYQAEIPKLRAKSFQIKQVIPAKAPGIGTVKPPVNITVPCVYTDGSCLKNPGGAGGWAFIVLVDNREEILACGSNPSTTNNRMELQAVIEALESTSGPEYTIYTDSQWVMKCATGEWKRKANLDLWSRYDIARGRRKVNYIWVKAHNGDKYNEIVDDLAREEANSVKK